MKKTIFYWLFALATVGIVSCSDTLIQEPMLLQPQPQREMTHEVTQAEARQQLEEILFDMKTTSTRGTINRLPDITSAHTTGKFTRVTRSTQEVEPYFHIFNFGDNEGFAIMSGDDRVEPLLALTFKGELSPDKQIASPCFRIAYSKIEEYYVNQVSSRGGGTGLEPDPGPLIPIDSIADDPHIRTETGDPIYEYFEPLTGYCPVKWGQDDPYNMYCETSDGRPAFTGCVTTAVAQLMAMYRFPTLYSSYLFNWNVMINTNVHEETGPGTYHIAHLMSLLGSENNLDVDYGAVADNDGSGADPDNIPRTFENFRYSDGGTHIAYNNSDVAEELINGYPILICGYDNDAGHMWLGHGYMIQHIPVYIYEEWRIIPSDTTYLSTPYVLCNMGYDGFYDGYYHTGCFDTNNFRSTRSTPADGDYSRNLSIVKGIRR